MHRHTLLETLIADATGKGAAPPTRADVILLQQLPREQLQARARRFVGLLREQDGCPGDNGSTWRAGDDQTVIYLAEGARAIVYHASGALRYVSGLVPADAPFAQVLEREALVRAVEERARKLNLPDWAGSNGELRFERLFQTLGRGADPSGKQADATLFRAIGAYRNHIGGIPVLGAASIAVGLAGDGRLDALSVQVRQGSGEVLARAVLTAPEAGARQLVAQLSSLLARDEIPVDAVESATMQFGYLDLGKRKPQRVLAPSYVAKIVLHHRHVRQAYVLAVSATERPYLDLPLFGSEAVMTRGRTDVAACETAKR